MSDPASSPIWSVPVEVDAPLRTRAQLEGDLESARREIQKYRDLLSRAETILCVTRGSHSGEQFRLMNTLAGEIAYALRGTK